jgi:chromosome segregation ATPase
MILIILSSLGILFSIAGISITWLFKSRLNQELSHLLDTVDATLRTTDSGLTIINGAVQDALDNLIIIESSFEDLGDTLTGVTSSLETSASLIGDDLRLTIDNTQTALSSASSSAEIIDDTLKVIASIPTIGADYQPDVPLHTSLEQVAGNLEDIPLSLETIEQSLKDTSTGLDSLKLDLLTLGENIGEMDKDLQDTRDVINDYQDIIKKVEQKLESLQGHLSFYLTIVGLILSGILFWLGLAQVSVLITGMDYWQGEQHIVNLADIQRK